MIARTFDLGSQADQNREPLREEAVGKSGVDEKNVRCRSRGKSWKLRRMQITIDDQSIKSLRSECRSRKFVVVRDCAGFLGSASSVPPVLSMTGEGRIKETEGSSAYERVNEWM